MKLNITCVDPRDEDSSFLYCPSFPAAVTFSALFALALISHMIQAFQYRRGWAWVIVMAAAWETAGFTLRTLNVLNPKSLGLSMPSTILILLSPLLINAFDYMVFGRMLYYYTPEKKTAGIRAQRLSTIFVLLDVATFLVQVAGASMASGKDEKNMMRGIHIYMIGIGVQEFFILIFLVLVIKFHRRMLELEAAATTTKPLADIVLRPPTPDSPLSPPVPSSHRASVLANPGHHMHDWHLYSSIPHPSSTNLAVTTGKTTWSLKPGWRTMVALLYVTLGLITIRVVYRLVEFSQGVWSYLPQHEVFFYCLEALPMFLAIAAWNWRHPGRIMRGEDSGFPRKVKKLTKEERKERNSLIKAAGKREKDEKSGKKNTTVENSDVATAV